MGGVAIAGARVLLTGATGGLGTVLAEALTRKGAQLSVSGRRAEALLALAAELGARAIVADLAERGDVSALAAAAGETDVLIACAALPGSGRLQTLEAIHVDRALEVNLRAPVALAHALLPGMLERRRGALVFIGSLAGTAPTAGASTYCASKFGLRGFALALRAELVGSGVGVSHIRPGFIREEGMYARTEIVLPRGIGSRTPHQVSGAVIRAIEHDRAEITVAPRVLGVGASLATLAPDFAAWASRHSGGDRLSLEFEERQADQR
jgi:short-subunit dehydrogenase